MAVDCGEGREFFGRLLVSMSEAVPHVTAITQSFEIAFVWRRRGPLFELLEYLVLNCIRTDAVVRCWLYHCSKSLNFIEIGDNVLISENQRHPQTGYSRLLRKLR